MKHVATHSNRADQDTGYLHLPRTQLQHPLETKTRHVNSEPGSSTMDIPSSMRQKSATQMHSNHTVTRKMDF